MNRKAAHKVRLHAGFNPGAWLVRHLQVALGSIGHLLRTPLGSLMTVAVIGIALSLPSGLLVLLNNLQQVADQWEGPASISLFLKQEVSDSEAEELARRIEKEQRPAMLQVISRSEALEEFRTHSGFGSVLEVLDENPLPALILVRPRDDQGDPEGAAAMSKRLGELPQVEFAQLDLQWVQRLYGITEIARRGTYLIALLLAAAVLLIVGNTIRLEIQNRREEIAIIKLVGGTNAFVRRPFLYHGFWLGLLGGGLAWLLVRSGTGVLEPSVTRLAELYHSGFRLLAPGLPEIAALLCGGALIGWLGAWVAVGRHIRAIEPD